MVHCWNENQWQTVCVTARACTRWWSLATWPLIRPSKPIVSVCSGFKGNTGQPGKPHSQTLEFAKGLWEAGIHLCVVKTLSGILRKHVHVNKQAGGKVPELSCSERFHLRWACIMIQMKMIKMRLMVIIRQEACIFQSSLVFQLQEKRDQSSSTEMDFWECTYNGLWMGFI